MNKRQAKKSENKINRMLGCSYKECKKIERDYIQELARLNHRQKFFNGFNEEEEFLIEIGMYKDEELINLYYNRKNTNNRWRQKRKYKKEVIA